MKKLRDLSSEFDTVIFCFHFRQLMSSQKVTSCNTSLKGCVHSFTNGTIGEAIPPLFGTPDSDLFRGYSVRRTLVRGTPTKVQMVRVRQILCSARKILKSRGEKLHNGCIKRIDRKSAHIFSRSLRSLALL